MKLGRGMCVLYLYGPRRLDAAKQSRVELSIRLNGDEAAKEKQATAIEHDIIHIGRGAPLPYPRILIQARARSLPPSLETPFR